MRLACLNHWIMRKYDTSRLIQIQQVDKLKAELPTEVLRRDACSVLEGELTQYLFLFALPAGLELSFTDVNMPRLPSTRTRPGSPNISCSAAFNTNQSLSVSQSLTWKLESISLPAFAAKLSSASRGKLRQASVFAAPLL